MSKMTQSIQYLYRHVVRTCTRLGDWFGAHMLITVSLILAGAFLLRLWYVDLTNVMTFNADAYLYLLKSLEIIQGDWTPMLTHAYGLSILAAPFLALWGDVPLIEHMMHARVFALLVSTLFLIPAFLIAREYLSCAGQVAVLALLAVHPMLVMGAGDFLTDMLFSTLVLFALYASIRGTCDVRWLYVAVMIGALSYWVRANGVFILAAVLAVFVLDQLITRWHEIKVARVKGWWRRVVATLRTLRYGSMLLHCVSMVALFVLLVAPMLFARDAEFGSPFTYGENDKIFVDNFTRDVWAPNIPARSLGEYLETHSLVDVIDKFVIQGFVKLVFSLVHGWEPGVYGTVVMPILLVPFLFGALFSLHDRWYLPVFVYLVVFVGGLSLVYHIMSAPRYLIFMIPLVYIFAWRALTEVLRGARDRTVVLWGAFVVIACWSLVTPITQHQLLEDGSTLPAWSTWVAANVRGTLITLGHSDYVMMQLPDTRVGGVGMWELYASDAGLQVNRYGQFETLDEALRWHVEHHDATHIMVNPWAIAHRPYLRDAASSTSLILVYEDGEQGDAVKIYQINVDALAGLATTDTEAE